MTADKITILHAETAVEQSEYLLNSSLRRSARSPEIFASLREIPRSRSATKETAAQTESAEAPCLATCLQEGFRVAFLGAFHCILMHWRKLILVTKSGVGVILAAPAKLFAQLEANKANVGIQQNNRLQEMARELLESASRKRKVLKTSEKAGKRRKSLLPLLFYVSAAASVVVVGSLIIGCLWRERERQVAAGRIEPKSLLFSPRVVIVSRAACWCWCWCWQRQTREAGMIEFEPRTSNQAKFYFYFTLFIKSGEMTKK